MSRPRLELVADEPIATEITVTADDIVAEYPTMQDEFVEDVSDAIDGFIGKLERIRRKFTEG